MKDPTPAQVAQRNLFQLSGSVSFVLGHLCYHTKRLIEKRRPDLSARVDNIIKQMDFIQKEVNKEWKKYENNNSSKA